MRSLGDVGAKENETNRPNSQLAVVIDRGALAQQRTQVRKASRVSAAPNALTKCQRVRRESDQILHNSLFHYLGKRIPRIADITDETTCAATGDAAVSGESRCSYPPPF
jgi:hypothetical protein